MDTKEAQILKEERAKRIIKARSEAKLTQAELAERTKLSEDIISKLETGKRELRDGYAVKIGEALHVRWEWLLFGDSIPQTGPMETSAEGKAGKGPQLPRKISPKLIVRPTFPLFSRIPLMRCETQRIWVWIVLFILTMAPFRMFPLVHTGWSGLGEVASCIFMMCMVARLSALYTWA